MRSLVAAHFLLGAAPLVQIPVRFDVWTLPILWTLSSLPIGSMMTLGLWVGMGEARLLKRLAIGLAAVLYLSAFSFIAHFAKIDPGPPIMDWVIGYLEEAAQIALLLVLLGGTFSLIGRRFRLMRVEDEGTTLNSGRVQFSMFQVMLAMSVIAILLGLIRVVRSATGHTPSTWETIATYALVFITFFINAACAALAALGAASAKRNVVFVLLLASMLGIATALATHNDLAGWWLFCCSMLIVIVPTLTALISLLVVRSAGWRLVRR